jgi:hypothetical protein
VDSGLSYSGVPASSFSGLDHLEGEVVAVVADGAVIYDGDPAGADAASFRVTGGEVVLSAAYENVHLGLPIRYGEIELLDLDVSGSSLRDKAKRVGSVSVLLDKSSRTFQAGPDENSLQTYELQASDAVTDLFSGQITIELESEFNDNGRILIRQTDPLPLTILGVLPMLEVGG